jgi:colanic acid biosynthesis glycosyl transferase WcaI
MHILIITQYFFPENFRVNELGAELVRRGHKVTVITGIPNYPHGRYYAGYGVFKKRTENYLGCRVLRVPLVPRGKSRPHELALNYLSFAVSATAMSPWLVDDTVDVILVCQLSPATVAIPGVVLKRIRHRPLILWVLDLWPESLAATGAVRSPAILGMVGRLMSAIYRSCDLVLVSSKGFIPDIERRGGRAGRILYFPNWVEDVYLEAPAAQPLASPETPAGAFRVMYAGNIGKAQGFETIVAAAEHLRHRQDIQWLIVGDGRMREWVERQVDTRGLRNTVHLLGGYPPDAMPALLACADALLVTLNRDPLFRLTAPGKIQSYLASGKLIIGALDGEGRQVLAESGAALLCSPEDSGRLAETVLAAARMPQEERDSMAEAGRRFCSDHFDRKSLMDTLEAQLETAVRGSR